MTTLLAVIGDRLGLFKNLAEHGSATPRELAARMSLNERFTREWLGAMASAGHPQYHTPTTPPSMLPPNAATEMVISLSRPTSVAKADASAQSASHDLVELENFLPDAIERQVRLSEDSAREALALTYQTQQQVLAFIEGLPNWLASYRAKNSTRRACSV